MLGVLIDGRRQTQRIVVTDAFRLHRHDSMLAEGERAGLVKDDRGHVAGLLESAAVTHEHSVARTDGGRDGDDERHGKAECVWARDDEHGHDAFDRE